MKNLKKYASLCLIVSLLTLTSCGDSKEVGLKESQTESKKTSEKIQEAVLTVQQFDALQMQVDTLSLRNMTGYVEANGQLEVPPQNQATITAVVGANVVSIEVIEGDKVNKNQVVAYLSHPNIIQKQTDYLNAYSESEFLRKEYERQKKLYDAGVGSGMNFQKAEASYQAFRAQVKGLEAQLQQFNISAAGVRNGTIYQRVALRSPIEGFVEKVSVRTGQYVEPQTDLFEIVNTHHVHAVLMVFEKDVTKVMKGQQVRLNIPSIPGTEMGAEIFSVSKTFEQDPKAVHVHAEINNEINNLIPGMYVQARIEVNNLKTNALPESAIATDGEKSFVFKAEQQADAWSFKPVEVKIGRLDNGWVAIDFIQPVAPQSQFAYNNAYYLMAEMEKGDAENSE